MLFHRNIKSFFICVLVLILSLLTINCGDNTTDSNTELEPYVEELFFAPNTGLVKGIYYHNNYTYQINLINDSYIQNISSTSTYFPCDTGNYYNYKLIQPNYDTENFTIISYDTLPYISNMQLYEGTTFTQDTIYQIINSPETITSIFNKYEYIRSDSDEISVVGVKKESENSIFVYNTPIKLLQTSDTGAVTESSIFNKDITFREYRYNVTVKVVLFSDSITVQNVTYNDSIYKSAITYTYLGKVYESLLE